MKKMILFLIELLIVLSVACQNQPINKSKLSVVVSILPLAEFVEKVGGDKVVVTTMIPPGASPHSYEPMPNQLVEISKADIYVKLGTPIEFELVWLKKILSLNKKMTVINSSAGIDLIYSNADIHSDEVIESKGLHPDPHVWLAPANAKVMVENIYQGLIAIDPKNQAYYETNKNSYLNELDALDKKIAALLSEKKHRKFLVYHPSWAYFAKAYQLEEISIEHEGKEPTAQDIQSIIQLARREHINLIIASPQFNTKSAGIIAKELNVELVLLNSLDKNFVFSLTSLAETLARTME
jgi:zinc transport system substrate-binding protein